MKLDSDAEAILAAMQAQGLPSMETLPLDEVRSRTAAAQAVSSAPAPEVNSVVEREVGGVPCLVVTPLGDESFDVLVWYHGGGWVIGTAAQSLDTAKSLASQGKVVVVVPDYRLAPENPFPAAFDDALAVAQGAIDVADGLGGPGARVAVGGDSAGGNLAALAALWVPGLAHQILAYPVLDATMSQPSYERVAKGYVLTSSMMAWFVELYAGGTDPADPRISPFFAPDDQLATVPAAHVVVAGFDPLADECLAYAKRLISVGIPVTSPVYEGQMHGFLTMGAMIPTGAAALTESAVALRMALDGTLA
jgi:acetyl esterase